MRRASFMSMNNAYLLVFILAVAGCLYFFYPQVENFFIFHPERRLAMVPSQWGLDYEEVHFNTPDNMRLHGWFFPLKGDPATILFCHGNAGNISHRLENITLLLDQGLQVFIFDYRGYGRSTGRPSEAGVYRDGLAAYDFLAKQKGVRPRRIVLFGRSLGAAVAIEIALQRKVRSLIMESAFTSTKEMARTVWLFWPLSFFSRPHY
ncbi:MAG: alpha/beta hydrolase, partial [Deltaproteobacteria bacterium]|nr:alpha/beta hydrolase [Deltaproteobacteria bacterium]